MHALLQLLLRLLLLLTRLLLLTLLLRARSLLLQSLTESLCRIGFGPVLLPARWRGRC